MLLDTDIAISVSNPNQEWTFIKYDVMGRIALSGRYQNSGSRATVQGLVNAATVNWEQRDAVGALGYTNVAFPTSNVAETYSANFYDDYDLPGSCPWNTLPSGSTEMVKGLPTASVSKILGTGTYLWKVNYYDEEGQLIVAKAQNNLNGTDEYYSYYNFSGAIDSIKRISAANSVTTTLREYYEYDHMGRLLATKQRINAQPEVILSSLEYNELGQVTSKKLHSVDNGANFLQKIDYAFNEQGWLKSINDIGISHSGNAKFGQELKYEDGSVPQYNGNISESKWKVARTGSSPQLGYKYSYDKLDRLTAAVSSTSGTDNGNYNENAVYDKLGNIRKLNRYALLSGVREKVDSLVYDYDGGKHIKIDDLSGASSGVKALGFNDQVQQATEYVYDGNGRLISDVNKGITAVAYTIANLPNEITWTPTKKLIYKYTAEGEKLQKKYVDGSTTIITAYNRGIEYVGRHVDSLQLQYIKTSEGRAWFDGTKFIYEYNLTDHLGNVRATIDADPSDVTQRTARVIQENSYYPFGMVMPGADINYTAGNRNNYLYTGKELQEELGEYDYGARFYDPAIARWSVADPLAESHYGVSAFAYVLNNPMMFVDPFGLKEYDPHNMTPEDWKNFDINNDSFVMREVNITQYKVDWEGMRKERIARREAGHQRTFDAMAILFRLGLNDLEETPGERAAREIAERKQKAYEEYSLKKGTFGNNASKQNESILEKAWNSPLARAIVPDISGLNVGFTNVLGIGYGGNAQIFIITRGNDIGIHATYSFGARVGVDVGISATGFSGYYVGGDVRNADYNSLLGVGVDISGSFSGITGGAWSSLDSQNRPTWVGTNSGFAAGPTILKFGGSVGVTYTKPIF